MDLEIGKNFAHLKSIGHSRMDYLWILIGLAIDFRIECNLYKLMWG